jgi:hypothetical protein
VAAGKDGMNGWAKPSRSGELRSFAASPKVAAARTRRPRPPEGSGQMGEIQAQVRQGVPGNFPHSNSDCRLAGRESRSIDTGGLNRKFLLWPVSAYSNAAANSFIHSTLRCRSTWGLSRRSQQSVEAPHLLATGITVADKYKHRNHQTKSRYHGESNRLATFVELRCHKQQCKRRRRPH